MAQQSATVEFDLSAGDLSLDFVNTLDGRLDDVPDEQLRSYSDLAAFGIESRIISRVEADQLLEEASRDPDAAETSLRRAIDVREAFYRIMDAVIDGHAPAADDLQTFNDILAETLCHTRVTFDDGHIHRAWEPGPAQLDRVFWPMVQAAMDLITSDDIDRVRECAAHDCGWLFLDTSRNRSRKWCSMTSCGNRAKVERFRKRGQADG